MLKELRNVVLSALLAHIILWGGVGFFYLLLSFIEWQWQPLMEARDFRVWEAIALFFTVFIYKL